MGRGEKDGSVRDRHAHHLGPEGRAQLVTGLREESNLETRQPMKIRNLPRPRFRNTNQYPIPTNHWVFENLEKVAVSAVASLSRSTAMDPKLSTSLFQVCSFPAPA